MADLAGITALSARSMWAVGFTGFATSGKPLIERRHSQQK